MSYTKHTWASGDTLTAAQMNEISEELETTQQNIPTKLASPHPVTFTGGATGTYDGSQAVTINIPKAGTGPQGEPGTSVSISSVSESTADGGSNVVTFSDGTTLIIKNGSKGSQGPEGKAGEAGTRGDKGDKGDKGDTGAQGPKGDKGDKGDPGDGAETTPSDIAAACDTLIEKVRGVIKADSIISLTMSDAHQLSSRESGYDNVNTGNKHAGLAAKYIAKRIPLTFAAFLGDYTTGNATTTTAEAKEHFSLISDYIADAFENIPNFRTTGNHDDLHSSTGVNGSTLPLQTRYSYIGVWNKGANYGDSTSGYCYQDFESQKLRVICLNTADDTSESFSSAQQTWFKNVLKEVGAKTGWNVIILSHHPLDWGAVCGASNIIYSYVNGSDVFSGSNNAKILLAIHGHVHGFKHDKLNYISNGTGTPYDVYRMAVPNMCFNRNNEYGQNGKAEYYGIEFGESTTYNKTADGVNDTAFTVNVINPSDEKVYSYHYGAGYDREFSIAKSTIAVTGVTVSPTSLSLEVGNTGTVTATVSPSTATNKTVTWTSSAPNIASVSNGVVTGVAVGSAVITATTVDGGKTATCAVSVTQSSTPKYTNIVPTLVDSEDTTQVFNGGLGYKNGAYASSASPGYNSDASFVCTGMIPTVWSSSVNTTWYIKGVDFNGASHSRLAYGNPSAYSSASNITDGSTAWNAFTVTKLGEKYYKVVQNGAGATHAGLKGWWFSAVGTGENLIVTKNEPIE